MNMQPLSARELADIWRRDTYAVDFRGPQMTQEEKDRHALMGEVERLRSLLAGTGATR